MIINEVKVSGFRGFTKEQQFNLSSPVTIFYGENGRGKSSLLNAIEWCLFGNQIVGKNTGIRERIDWEIKNRTDKGECYVELKMEEDGQIYLLKRKLISKTKEEVEICLPNGDGDLKGEAAKQKLDELLHHYTFKDFLSSVYQHQEVIRFILTQEPKERNEAMDRLLGLSEYRNIIEGIKASKLKPDELENEIESLKQRIEGEIEVWQKQINEAKKDLSDNYGVAPELISFDQAIDFFEHNLKGRFHEFSSKSQIGLAAEFQGISLSAQNSLEFDLINAIQAAKAEIRRLRSAMPDVKEQVKLHQEIAEREEALRSYDATKEKLTANENNWREFVEKNGNLSDLEAKNSQLQLAIEEKEKEKEKVSLLGTIIAKAINYLNSIAVEEQNTCPVCGSEKDGLLRHLEEEYEQQYKQKIEALDEAIEQIKAEQKQLKKLISWAEDYQNKLELAKKAFQKEEDKIRNKYNVPEREDLVFYLQKEIKELRLKEVEIKKNIEEKQNILASIENEVLKLEKIVDVLRLQEQRDRAREIEESPKWQELKQKAEELKVLQQQIETISDVLKEVMQEEAQNKITSIKTKVKDYFALMTKHPLLSDLELEVAPDSRSGGNAYSFKDGNGREVTPILSQGHYNALALSIFFSIADSNDTHPFDFMMFDDPSQSLGTEEKERFVEILSEVAEKKNLLLSTMDKELLDLLENILTKQKKIYEFQLWKPVSGPEVQERI